LKTPDFSTGQSHLRFNLSIEPNTRRGSYLSRTILTKALLNSGAYL
jgi:hypothetical protein